MKAKTEEKRNAMFYISMIVKYLLYAISAYYLATGIGLIMGITTINGESAGLAFIVCSILTIILHEQWKDVNKD